MNEQSNGVVGKPGVVNASLVTERFVKDRHVRIIIKCPESD